MDVETAADLLRPLVTSVGGGTWADIGAGRGVFTRALAELLGSGAVVYAVDRDRSAVRRLESLPSSGGAARIIAMEGDLTETLSLPPLDGVLLANTLHYVPPAEQGSTLARLTNLLRPGGRLIVAEYDGRRANPWVPHPIPVARLRELADRAGLEEPVVAATRPSAYGGLLYVAGLRMSRA
jgi:SAM-dependent methyltransferase